MNRSIRVLAAPLAAALILVAGCSRSDNDSPATRPRQPAKPPLQARELPNRPRISPLQMGQPPDLTDARLAEEEIPPVPVPQSLFEPRTSEARGGKGQADALFTRPALLSIDIVIPQAGLNALRRTQWQNGQQRPVAKATIREGGVVYTNVAVHLKGAAGSFRSVDDRPALTLNFAKFVPGQGFHGLHKISLNNSVQDPYFLCEKIAREIFLAAGVPTPRAAHALVTLNGRDLGLYVLLEGANKQFLKRYFSNAKGNLYDGGFCQDLRASLAVNCGDNPQDDSGLRALLAVVHGPSPSLAQFERVLDVDRFLSMMAIEMMLCHWDGYTQNRNNWRIFHDLDANKMVFIPHGLDQLFGLGRQFDPNSPVMPRRLSGDVSRLVLNTREGQRRYRERVNQLYTNVFKADHIAGRVDEIVAALVPALAKSHPQLARLFQQRANNFKNRILERGEGLRRQLGPPSPPVQFDADGILRLTGWKPSVLSGEPNLKQATGPAGSPLLAINAGQSLSSSSWRTRVDLRQGRYQLEGRIRVNGVAIDQGDSRGGAGLRISKGRMPSKLTGTSPWKVFTYPFTVQEETENIEFICELRATKGEAWFETASLKLVRLP